MKKHLLVLGYLLSFAVFTAAQTTTLTLQPGPNAGKDAELFSCVPCGYSDKNYGDKQDLNAIAWTNNGAQSNIRSLIQFNLSSIPAGATITNARLSLYYNADNQEGQHVSNFFFKNTTYIERITTNWSETTVTWNTQPNVTSLNRVTLAASTSSTQNYPNINVTALVQDMINNPAQSFGFRLKMKTEHQFRKLLFASSDNLNTALHPKLIITYSVPSPKVSTSASTTLKIEHSSNFNTSMNIYPNPVKDILNISFQSNGINNGSIKICNLSGEEIYNHSLQITQGNNRFSLQTGNWTKGIYFVTVKTAKEISTKKILVQ